MAEPAEKRITPSAPPDAGGGRVTNELLQRIFSYVPQELDRLVPKRYRGRETHSALRPRYQAFRTFGPDWRA